VNIYKQIEVRPFVDFRALEEVMVLLVPQSPEEPMSSVMPPASSPAPNAASTATTKRPRLTTTTGAQ
jgi:hypothetical protein